ncbi:class D sortase [Oceanobacillus manasiensis]|uniref:class D sortase n=1 Tax=Oceanobacillus manasiensis TaxID=586413 RepID=UPI0005AB2A90|nr:class D sortase [Oceanobacillus manasiensis]
MKKLSLLLIVAGIVLLGFGGYQWFHTAQAQKNSLAEAHTMLDKEGKVLEKEEVAETAKSFFPEMGETTGILEIPRLNAELPIVEGTDEDELAKGVGHYKGTAYPGQNDQIVLSGHRDTVFRSMGELELGDHLTVKVPYGEFTYEIVDTKVVDADDRTIISPTTPDEVLTLTTCYPFSFVGSAPDRYIITALPIEKK